MKRFSVLSVWAAAASLMMPPSAVLADILECYQTSLPTLITSESVAIKLPLTDQDAAAVTFFNPRSGLVSVTYSAECAVKSTIAQSWVSIQILIDYLPVAPTGGRDDKFCSNTNVNGQYSYGMNSITVAQKLPQGLHTLAVSAILGSGEGSATARIDDQAILIAQ
jgi:hypothetical protein